MKQEEKKPEKTPKNQKSAKQQAKDLAEQAKAAFGLSQNSDKDNSSDGKGPRIEMQGVSGKIITGVVKLVKRKPDNKPDKEIEETATEELAPKTELDNAQTEAKPSSQTDTVQEQVAEQPKVEAKEDAADRVLPVAAPPVTKIGLVKDSKTKKPSAVAKSAEEIKPEEVKAEVVEKAEKTASKSVAKNTAKTVEAKAKQSAKKSAPTEQASAKVATEKGPEPMAKTEPEKSKVVKAEQPATASEVKQETKVKAKTEVEKKAAKKVSESKPKPEQKVVAPANAIQPIIPPGKEIEGCHDLPVKPVQVRPGLVKAEAEKPKVVVDTGVRRSSYQGPIIRPQEGSYLGSDADKPVFEKRRYNPNARRAAGGRGRQRQPFVQDKDKDEEKPRAGQRRRPARKSQATTAALPEAGKDQVRRSFEQKRQDNRRRSESDWRLHHQAKERSFEQELLRQSRHRRQRKKAEQRGSRATLTHVKLPESLTVKELAELLKKTSAEVITKLMGYGVMATVNHDIDYDTAEIIAGEFGIKAELEKKVTEEDILFDDSEDKEEDLVERPPVVVVMGHVDHGKTSILDYIRNAHVTRGEAGGITQHIGAYTVDLNGRQITFLDTPGHEAFTAMRARGAQVTDIAILVVAADDGVMPQTIEAINHARQAGTKIIVAINKMDKPTANVDRVKQELANQNILAPDWGGDIEMIPVSAKTGQGMDDLLEMVLLTADVLELKANPDRQAKGTVIESYLDRGRGPVATVLVQRGTLHQGDMIVVGPYFGNIRAMTNDRGQSITEAGPSMPVEILGLPDVPEGGEIFYQVENEKVARSLAERRQDEERELALSKKSHVSLDNLFSKLAEGEVQELNIIVKADVQGSVEAVKQSLEKLSNKEVKLQVIHGTVGAITESDVRLAEVSEAIIIGFNVRPPASVAKMASEQGVDIRLYQVIYEAIEDMEKAMTGLLAPEFQEFVLGHAEVREIYKVSSIGMIAGCFVTDGVVQRRNKVRCLRDNIVLHDGELASLKRFKDDVREVREGYECGISIDRFNDIRVGDVFEFYEIREVERSELSD
ncbi:MAG: translation initiation factor IF-2 [Eubacteriales bacterium]|nr:translation initiation factor IF-2 [Eubacteriales bacterium]